MGTHNFQPSPFTSHLFSLNRSSNARSALRSSACCENESMSVMPWQLRGKKKKQKTMEEKSRPCSPRPPTIIGAKTRSYRSNQINFLNCEIITNFCHLILYCKRYEENFTENRRFSWKARVSAVILDLSNVITSVTKNTCAKSCLQGVVLTKPCLKKRYIYATH